MGISEKNKTKSSLIKDGRLADHLVSKKTRYNQRVYIEGLLTGIAVSFLLLIIIEIPCILLWGWITWSFLDSPF